MTCENFANWKCPFRSLRNCLSTWCGCLPMAITSSFQLWFAHHLKRWTFNFLSFETTYSMHKIGLQKVFEISPTAAILLDFFMLDSSLCFSSLHSWFDFGKGLQSSKACILLVNELPFDFPWIIQSSTSILDCFGDKKKLSKTPNLTQFD